MTGGASRDVALVTGAGGTLGRAVAIRLAESGSAVVLADLPAAAEALEETAAACTRGRGGSTIADRAVDTVTFDVSRPSEVDAAFDDVSARFGPIQLVVNNEGYQGVFQNVADYDLDDLQRVLEVNVVGVFVVLRATARRLREAGVGGSIVNLASMAHHGAANMPAYSASKGAVVSLTRAAALDLAPARIRVNSVSPGFIGPGVMWERQVALQASTPSQYYADDAETVAEQMISAVPMRRYGSPEEVADVVAFLLSDAASYLTGVDIEIAGGIR